MMAQKQPDMPSVVFVSCSRKGKSYYQDASARYRCLFPAEALSSLGWRADVVHISQTLSLRLRDYQIMVIHRPTSSLQLRHLLWRAKREGLAVMADIDDLLFCPEAVESLPAVCNGTMSRLAALKRIGSYHDALSRFSHLSFSTQALVREASHVFSADLNWVPNTVPPRWYQPWPPLPLPLSQQRIMRYLPGSGNHDHDFALINEVLSQVMLESPGLKLEVFGPIRPNFGSLPKNRVSFHKAVPYEALPMIMRNSWVTLAPLVKNRFNQCKSGLKFWESALLGVPVIATPMEDITRFNCAGLKLATSPDEWYRALHAYSVDSDWQTAQTEGFNSALDQATSYTGGPVWQSLLLRVLHETQ
ncbi:hypothetical protein [Zobellella sp. DQSA1]|uniref:hypothetical protein n=1 Tax=Zobellella sp. DQSA1 TaxID=3342386 RepID=UPI0035C1798C